MWNHIHTTITTTTPPPGFYYLAHGGDADACPFAPCTNALPGQQYVKGWAVTAGGCSTRRCESAPGPGKRFGTPGSCALGWLLHGPKTLALALIRILTLALTLALP